MKHNVPIQSLIDHIKTAIDVDDWAKEMVEELLEEQERKKGSWDYGTQCSVCKGTIVPPKDRKVRVNFCPWCGADMRDSYEQEGR